MSPGLIVLGAVIWIAAAYSDTVVNGADMFGFIIVAIGVVTLPLREMRK